MFPVDKIAAMLSHRELNLRHCSLGDRGMQAVSEALKYNTTVEKVCLAGNFITPVGGAALCKALEVSALPLSHTHTHPHCNTHPDVLPPGMCSVFVSALVCAGRCVVNTPSPPTTGESVDQFA